jgi:hypothetical protein
LLILAFAVALVAVPLGITGWRQLYDSILIQQANHFLEQTLPAAYICLDRDRLAEGLPVLNESAAKSAIMSIFQNKMPPSLKGRLILGGI